MKDHACERDGEHIEEESPVVVVTDNGHGCHEDPEFYSVEDVEDFSPCDGLSEFLC